MAKVRLYCSLCRHPIRNQLEHNRTLEHRRNLDPHKRTTKKAQRAAHRARIRGRSQGDSYIHVDRYRRSPPRDGKRRTIRVVDHWRPLPHTVGSKVARRRAERDELARFLERARESLLPWSQRSTT